jgi:L-lactate dehydrogenase complex protein LldG
VSARENILGRIKAAVGALPDRRALPDDPPNLAFARGAPRADAGANASLGGNRVGQFSERMAAAGGRVFSDPAALGAWLTAQGATRGLCDPALAPRLAAALGGGFMLETALDRGRIDEYQFGVTRAAGAIAETGTLILTDAGTSSRLAALAPWIHVAVLEPAQIHAHIADAISALGGDPNVIWCTGPSKTADVEGILIQGVHGPGEQVALIL